MSYIIRRSDGTLLTTIQEGLVDQTASSLNLIGKNVSGFGQYQNDNYLWLMEHFAYTQEPRSPVMGQIWFDSNSSVLRPVVNDGTNWRPLSVLLYSSTSTDTTVNSNGLAFASTQPGDFWYKSDDRQLYINTTATGYQLIGPERVPGFLETKMRSTKIADSVGVNHPVIQMLIDGEVVSIMSNKTFATTSSIAAIGFPSVYRGVTFKNYNATHRYENTTTDVTLHGINSFLDETYPRRDQTETIPSQWAFTNGISIGGTPSVITNDANNNLSINSADGNISLFVNGGTGVAGVYQEGIIPSDNLKQNLGNINKIWNNLFVSNVTSGGSGIGGNLQGSWALTNNSRFLPFADLGNDFGLPTQRWNTTYTVNINPGNNTGQLQGDWKLASGTSFLPYNDQGNSIGSGSVKFNTIHAQSFNAGAGLPAYLIGEFEITGSIVPASDMIYHLGAPGQMFGMIHGDMGIFNNVNSQSLTAKVSSLTDTANNNITRFDADTALSADSNGRLPTQHAVKRYADDLYADLIAKIAALQNQLTNALAGIKLVPAGTISHFAGSTAPDGYLVCDGRSIITTSYPDLFSAIGYTYGGGGTSFNVPNLLGEFIRGWDAGRGVDAGRNLGSFQNQDFASHAHNVDTLFGQIDDRGGAATDRNGNSFQPYNQWSDDNDADTGAPVFFATRTYGAGGSETRPRNIALLPIIKFRNGG